MKSYLANFNDKSSADAADLAAALSGVSNGRNERFLNVFDSDASSTGRGKDKSDSVLDILLTQLPYEQYLAKTIERIRETQDTVDRALEIAASRFNQDAARLDKLEALAAEMPDGTKVAMDKHGELRTLDGVIVDPELAAEVEIGPQHPTFETIDAQRERTDQSLDDLNQVREDELKLGEFIEEIQNGNSPRERIDAVNERITDIQERNEAIINAQNNEISKPTEINFSTEAMKAAVPII